MTNQEINIAIAEACGISGPWTEQVTPCGCDGQWDLFNPNDVRLPDYCNDLNAMHGAEETLIGRQKVEYAEILKDQISYGSFEFASASARQRSEAFLKTLGKWKWKE